MIKGKTLKIIRKTHRYLALIIGLQFLFWSASGVYFSWTDIDEIHGDQFLKEVETKSFNNLLSLDSISSELNISSLDLIPVLDEPYYWINNSLLIHARTGKVKSEITEREALEIADVYLIEGLELKDISLITETGKHHEFRERPLPAWVINYNHPDDLSVYIDARNGSFQRIRHSSWRVFDLLWMFHTMDYEGRDNINTVLLRIFSLAGLITVLSGYLLWYVSSPTIRKIKEKISA